MTSAGERLGRALMAARAERGLKRKELAEAAGLSYPYVAEIENGGKQPSAKALQALAVALEMTPAELLARSEALPGGEPAPMRGDPGRDAPLAFQALGFRTAAPPVATPSEEELAARLSASIAAVVHSQLQDWLRQEIPRLVREEVARTRNAKP